MRALLFCLLIPKSFELFQLVLAETLFIFAARRMAPEKGAGNCNIDWLQTKFQTAPAQTPPAPRLPLSIVFRIRCP